MACRLFFLWGVLNYSVYGQNIEASSNYGGRIAISAVGSGNSLTAFLLFPSTIGVSAGINIESRITQSNYLGFEHVRGVTTIPSEFILLMKLHSSLLYLYRFSPQLKVINQLGVSSTVFKYIDSNDPYIMGNRYVDIGVVLGNNNIFIFKNLPKLKLGFNSNIALFQYSYPHNTVPSEFKIFLYSFTYISLKYLLANPK